MKSLISKIIDNNTSSVELETEKEKQVIKKSIRGEDSEIGEPDAREYILRCVIPKPFSTSKPVAHKIYTVLEQGINFVYLKIKKNR